MRHKNDPVQSNLTLVKVQIESRHSVRETSARISGNAPRASYLLRDDKEATGQRNTVNVDVGFTAIAHKDGSYSDGGLDPPHKSVVALQCTMVSTPMQEASTLPKGPQTVA